MKEQDAAHSFIEGSETPLGFNVENVKDRANANIIHKLNEELTRLRSELQQKDESYYALMENAASLMERDARRISDLIQLFIDTTGKHPDDLKKQSQIIDYNLVSSLQNFSNP